MSEYDDYINNQVTGRDYKNIRIVELLEEMKNKRLIRSYEFRDNYTIIIVTKYK